MNISNKNIFLLMILISSFFSAKGFCCPADEYSYDKSHREKEEAVVPTLADLKLVLTKSNGIFNLFTRDMYNQLSQEDKSSICIMIEGDPNKLSLRNAIILDLIEIVKKFSIIGIDIDLKDLRLAKIFRNKKTGQFLCSYLRLTHGSVGNTLAMPIAKRGISIMNDCELPQEIIERISSFACS